MRVQRPGLFQWTLRYNPAGLSVSLGLKPSLHVITAKDGGIFLSYYEPE